jgi:hypothetical protein
MFHVGVSRVEILLPRRQQAEIRPTGGFARSELRRKAKLLLRPNVVSALQRRDTHKKGADDIAILLRLGTGQTGMAAGATEDGGDE